MYQALYRKWRPKIFDDVSGQQHITDTLKNQLISGKLSHAYLFSGSRGTGKTSTAKILSRAVNCLNPENGNPCNTCSACLSAIEGSAVDIIEMDAASNNSVDDARTIIDEVIYTPAELKKKVYIIDEAHMLTTNAFNALLKTLEEPPEHVLFIFATTEPHQFPPTILSRCQRFDFKRITPYDAEMRMKYISEKEGYAVSEEALGLIGRISDGAMRDALGILDQCFCLEKKTIGVDEVIKVTGIINPGFVYEFVGALVTGNLEECFIKINEAYESGRNLLKLPDELINALRNMLVTKTLSDKESMQKVLSVGSYELERYISLSENISSERIIRYIDVISKTAYLQKHLNNPRLALEMTITGIAKNPESETYEGLLERIGELENKITLFEKRGFAAVSTIPTSETAAKSSQPKKEEKEAEEEIMPQIHSEVEEEKNNSAVENPIYQYIEEDETESRDNGEFQNQEEPDYPINSEEIAKTQTQEIDYDIKTCWNDVVIKASNNSLMGFDKIISSTKKVFVENGVELYFSEESYYNLAKTCKFDENISKAFSEILKRSVSVKFLYSPAEDSKIHKQDDSNFDELFNKLGGQ